MNEIFYHAQRLVENLRADIPLASTRAEHMRASMRASEAEQLMHMLQQTLDDGK